MNYEKLYNKIVNNALNRKEDPDYYETHHIRPRCIGGTDDSSNLVKFTAREHFIAHWLLTKIYKNTRYKVIMLKAFTAMNMVNDLQKREITSHRFEALRRAYIQSSTGEGNPMFGKQSHNLGKTSWYIPSKGIHVYSNKKPSPDAIKGRNPINTGGSNRMGDKNGMSGVNIYEELDPDKVKKMKDARKATYYSKSEEEREIINKGRAFGFQFMIQGVHYPHGSVASKELGITLKMITSRCLSDKYPEWKRYPRTCRFEAGSD